MKAVSLCNSMCPKNAEMSRKMFWIDTSIMIQVAVKQAESNE